MNLYVREIVSPLEVFEYKKCIKKINSIKNRFIKKCFNNLLKMIINFKYNCFYMTGKIIGRLQEAESGAVRHPALAIINHNRDNIKEKER